MRDEGPTNHSRFKAVVIGVSSGGIKALSKLFSLIAKSFDLPIIVVQHLHASADVNLAEILNGKALLTVKEADEKEQISPGIIYIAPANYHLLIEADETFSLSIDKPVSYSRPSIDVLFESAAHVWSHRLIGIILTGANMDGAEGIRFIKDHGGLTIAQDPTTAEVPMMPQEAINTGKVDKILTLDGISNFLNSLESTQGEVLTNEPSTAKNQSRILD